MIYLVLKLSVAEGTDAARLAALRRLLSSLVREGLRAHEAEGTIAAGEILCGDFCSVLAEAEDMRAQAKRGRAAGAAWRKVNGDGVAQVRAALDDVTNGRGRRVAETKNGGGSR